MKTSNKAFTVVPAEPGFTELRYERLRCIKASPEGIASTVLITPIIAWSIETWDSPDHGMKVFKQPITTHRRIACLEEEKKPIIGLEYPDGRVYVEDWGYFSNRAEFTGWLIDHVQQDRIHV